MTEERYQALKKYADKIYMKILTVFIGAVLIWTGINSGFNIAYVAIGLLLLVVAVYDTTIIADKEGIHSTTRVLFHTHSYSTKYTELIGIVAEHSIMPDMRMNFVKSNANMKTKFASHEGERVLAMALRANPNLEIRRVRPRRGLF